ncbi:MAG TPA: M28 family metallopeptidase [Longimicrobiaceae bacterium]|nr:M28 family metallopeptidase [Longimicrobiaceae bacterium]
MSRSPARTLALAALAAGALALPAAAQPQPDARLHEIARAPSAARIEADIRRLAAFGTRHTLSDTVSPTRGIGAARRWLFAEFQRISQACGGCLEVRYVGDLVRGDSAGRIPRDTRVVNVVAIQRGRADPGRYVLMAGHYDSRVTNALDSVSEAPGANDDASGVAGVLEAARVLSAHRFDGSIVYAALAGEEQGLHGGQILAKHAKDNGWRIEGVLNNDIIGNTRGITGAADNTVVRLFGPGIPPTANAAELRRILTTGGELDGPSRQLMRYVDRVADLYTPTLDVMMIYRLDRFGRGGDHSAFFNEGFPAVRFTELYEDYTRQHQDLRVENGIRYGDVPDAVDFAYTARITALNAASLASLAWAPPSPDTVAIRGGVSPHTTLRWSAVRAPDLAGYRIYWRAPEAAQWQHSRWVGNVTEFTLENVVIDNWFFAVAAVDAEGHESRPVFPVPGR